MLNLAQDDEDQIRRTDVQHFPRARHPPLEGTIVEHGVTFYG